MQDLKIFSYLIFAVLIVNSACAEQVPDFDFKVERQSSHKTNKSKAVVLIDEGHNNYHTKDYRFSPFSKLLQANEFLVKKSATKLDEKSLSAADILVIANARISDKLKSHRLPAISSFTDNEIQAINKWVKNGGSLLLIADHMPYPGAISKLAYSFDYSFYNGFATYKDNHVGTYNFTREKIRLSHPVLDGKNGENKVANIFVFSGSAFRAPTTAINILSLPRNFKVRLPTEEWEFSDSTPEIPALGLSQGAISLYGKGKVAVFSEAAMFTAQVQKENGKTLGKVGFNIPEAKDNQKFIVNLLDWLSS